jgi:Tol biopolymer transport system component
VGSELNEYPSDWSRDGRHLIYTADSGGPGGLDIWYLRRKPDGNGFESVPFLEGRFNQQSGKLSPDGRFLAYCSDDSGRSEVFVRPFPEGGGQWPVSPAGGCDPRWSHDGKELFYVVGNTLMAAAVTTSAGFSAGAVVRLFQDVGLAQGGNRYDVSADGKRFLTSETLQNNEAKAHAIHIVQNWFAEFEDRQRD